ncbi:hypothetical protein J3Q64DRAFT_1734002 [Phycomyces blakesleeanus]|uniref:Uncharacterized protein n=2 Tax=Phycomyces blakesleeanus TaxID=4837 RepID=A0A167L3Z7_PHYB8|nr:hypothetical protein PHYBLDRAFT_66229 [Phycomyces blakesleeanus NRRL 1555(-)]OAD69546.1 hypothetical protein PHYBLDRAFT_66229 [Phycomyces blakesleeanus NRRL 1555(-)]|eukprot:XP_018287586.1 hypothetical protein PHYBLDRAFT_66229 [Phycomyces blakesleeanus NRRL 1555(-)]
MKYLWVLSLLVFTLLLHIQSIYAQGVSKTGKKDGNAIFKSGVNVPQGKFHFKNIKTGKYLDFLPGNLPEPVAGKKSASNLWIVKRYSNKYFEIRHDHGTAKKCLSARWTKGVDDAGVMWQCELKNMKRSLGDQTLDNEDIEAIETNETLSKRYAPIVWTKQVWVFVPVSGKAKTYKIIAVDHLYDMTPKCLSHKPTGGKGKRGGTILKSCKYNTKDTSLYWKME